MIVITIIIITNCYHLTIIIIVISIIIIINCDYISSLSMLGGPATTVYWMFDCEVDGIIMESQFSFDKIFPSQTNQSCQITLRLQNNINSTLAYGSIELKESVIINSLTSNGPVKENQTIIVTISLQKFGTQTCLWVDLGDNSSLLVFGDSSCSDKIDVSQINPNIVSDPSFTFSPRSSNVSVIVIDHVYPATGSYDVRMNASNDVSMLTEEMIVVVLPNICHNPIVTITGNWLINICFL